MNEIEQQIVALFESKSNNFKKGMKREIEKPLSALRTKRMRWNKDRMINELYQELIRNGLGTAIEPIELLQMIEPTLFNYLN